MRADEGAKTLNALQFHFHAPSEHSVNGKLYDFEMHIVHLFPDGSLGGVLGFFFDREAGGDYDNDFLSSFDFGNSDLDYDTQVSNVRLQDFIDEVQDSSAFWSYKGSLTTPPCTEGVYWTVFEDVQPISEEQLEGFTRHFADNYDFAQGKGNNREIMPLNDRTLYFSHSCDAARALATSAVALALAALSFF